MNKVHINISLEIHSIINKEHLRLASWRQLRGIPCTNTDSYNAFNMQLSSLQLYME